ncbi:MAG: MFS transporter, partial [Xanthobacteraceae bacterium]
LPAIYPILKSDLALSFGQIGLLTLVYQGTDKRPQAYSLPLGMVSTLCGLCIIAFAPSFLVLLSGAGLLGVGSAIFHPESSRIARLASNGAHGFAQSLFQVGGNFGSSIAPLAAAFFILPHGRDSLAWFALVVLIGVLILVAVGRWYQIAGHSKKATKQPSILPDGLAWPQVQRAIAVLVALIFSKFFYLSSITSYYIFYLMHRFDMTTENAQLVSVRLPRSVRRRHLHRWSDWRSLWT